MKKYELFTAKEIKPAGWMLRQLEIEANGQSGNLDKMWPDVRDSAWIGGTCEGWERVPYWLDGFIPLAYLLDSDDMKARAKKYVDAIIERQCDDGWICPCTEDKRFTYEIWALFLLSKTLTVYYDCTGDERIPDVIYRAMKNCYGYMKEGKIVLDVWGKRRWFEAFIALDMLYSKYNEAWIKELAKMLRDQGTKWNELTERWITPLNKWTQETHIVNLMMSLKYEAVSHSLLDEEYTGITEKLYDHLYKYNGTPIALFTGDECLAGLSPIQGTELCAVVEEMFSCELLFAYTGNTKWLDILEKASFNGLPATTSEDMWTHQYVQQSNQIDCTTFPGKPIFRTVSKQAHIFGLMPHFGCCTANQPQGWPKLMLSAFMKAEDGIVSAVTIPGSVKTEIKGKAIEVSLATDFPFRPVFDYTVKCEEGVKTKLMIRVPAYAKHLTVNGKAARAKDGFLTIEKTWKGEETVHVEYVTDAKIVRTPAGLYCAEMGPLVFSLPREYTKTMTEWKDQRGVERKFPYCDYEIEGKGEWRYAFENAPLVPEFRGIDKDVPFSETNPAVVLKAKLSRINWELADGYERIPAPKPASPMAIAEPEDKVLHPYGCSRLRMTEMPFALRRK